MIEIATRASIANPTVDADTIVRASAIRCEVDGKADQLATWFETMNEGQRALAHFVEPHDTIYRDIKAAALNWRGDVIDEIAARINATRLGL